MSLKDELRPWFDGLPEPVLERLSDMLKFKAFAPGEQIFVQGTEPSAIYFLIEGHVKTVRVTPEGYESILCVRRPGEFFCPVTVLDGGPELGTAIAMTEVRALYADRDEFVALCNESPELLAIVQGACLTEVRDLIRRLEVFAFRSVRERLAFAILTESRRQADSSGNPNELRLTRQELGALVGASRESVSRTLVQLERDGVVELGRGIVIIRDRRKLEKLAGF